MYAEHLQLCIVDISKTMNGIGRDCNYVASLCDELFFVGFDLYLTVEHNPSLGVRMPMWVRAFPWAVSRKLNSI